MLSASRRFGFRRPRRWLAAGGASLAAAAGILLAVTLFWHSTPQALADDSAIIAALKAGANFFSYVRLADPYISDDPQDLAAREQAVEEARAERDAAVRALEESKTSKDPRTEGLWHSWQRYYEGLRDLGRRDESLAEARKACDFALDNPAGDKALGWYAVYLDGLANVHLRFGEYAAARAAYQESIEVREAALRRAVEEPGGSRRLQGLRAEGLGPMFLRLTTLCLLEGDAAEARKWCDQAEAAMRDWMVQACQLDHRDVPPDASMWDAWNRLPEEFRSPRNAHPTPDDSAYWGKRFGLPGASEVVPTATMVTWTRAVLYHRAVLATAAEDYSAAEQALDRAESIKDFPTQDELRLCFHLPLLRARLVILAHRDYAAALRLLDEAESKSGELIVPAEPNLNKLPISPARMAELYLLRGLALLGLEEVASGAPAEAASGAPAEVASGAPAGRPDGSSVGPAVEAASGAPAEAASGAPGGRPDGSSVGPAVEAASGAPAEVASGAPAGRLDGSSVGPPWPTSALSTQPSLPMTPRRAEALRLINRSLALPEKLAAGLPAEQREKFLSQFAAWAKLAAKSRQQIR